MVGNMTMIIFLGPGGMGGGMMPGGHGMATQGMGGGVVMSNMQSMQGMQGGPQSAAGLSATVC